MAGVCNAEPDSTIKYLIDEPVSMLDYGIARMERMIPPPVNGNVSVSYSWEENRIIISVDFIPHRQDPYNPPYKDKEEAKNKIKEYLKKLKIFLKTTSFNEVYFNHAGYRSPNEPKDLDSKLKNITEIKFYTTYGKPKSDEFHRLRGRTLLLSEAVNFEE